MKVPILRIHGILLISIQVELTDEEAQDLQVDVLRKVFETEAPGLVIDVTAMDVVDSYLARVISDTAKQAELLGAKVMLSGMQPSVAMALVEMGRELEDIQKALNIDQAFSRLEAALQERRG